MSFFNLPFPIRIAGADPVDGERYLAADLTERNDLIGSGREYDGLQVFVESEKLLYILEDKTIPTWTVIGSGGSIDLPLKYYWIVDPINGDDSTGEKGNILKPHATIAGAELGATSGDTIKIVSDIVEANCGKDGLTYIFDENVQMYWPSTNANITGQNWNALFTDYGATGTEVMSYTIIGGKFLAGSYWYGNWRRSVVRLNAASSVKMIAAETIGMEQNDGWIFHMVGDNSRIDVTCSGDITNSYEVLRINGNNVTANIHTQSSIVPIENSGIVIVRTSAVSNYHVVITAEINMSTRGHDIGVERRPFHLRGSTNSTKKSTVVINTPVFDYYDNYPNTAGDEYGLVTLVETGVNIYVAFNADIVKIHHDVSIPGGYYQGGRAGLYSSSGGQNFTFAHIDFNIRLLLLGINHNLDYCRNTTAAAKPKTLINLIDCTIVSYTDNADTYNDWRTNSNRDNTVLIPTMYTNYVFKGDTVVVMNPVGATAGKKVIGSYDNVNDGAFIMGEFVSNADIKNTTFEDLYTGTDYATGIPKMKLLNNNILTDYTNYENII